MRVSSPRAREGPARENVRVMQRTPECGATTYSEWGPTEEGRSGSVAEEIAVGPVEGFGVCICVDWGSPWLSAEVGRVGREGAVEVKLGSKRTSKLCRHLRVLRTVGYEWCDCG
jgi:hypothetical protein